MTATFGKLQQAELQLQPGLNVIYAPNESGKSTWTAFLRTMLYGLSTRERGALADKNRYAPWSGGAMQGRMDVFDGEQRYTIMRNTKRANSPMGDFSCTYCDTATPVPGITAQNLGETLTGVPREVFERSALIRQSALSVDQDAELERRIAALITTGEEDTSYTEAYDRLKKQLNRHKHNKTGLIPALEREIDALDESLAELSSLNAKIESTQAHFVTLEQQLQTLQMQDMQWEQLAKQEVLQKYRQAQQTAADSRQRIQFLVQMAGDLPESSVIAQMDGQISALQSAKSRLNHAEKSCEDAAEKERSAHTAYRQHTLYPADENELEHRMALLTPPKMPGKGWFTFIGIAVLALLAIILMTANALPLVSWQMITACLGFLTGICGTAVYMLRKRKVMRQIAEVDTQKAALSTQIADYLPLRQQASDAHAQCLQAQSVYQQMSQQYQQDLALLLTQIQVFQPAVTDLSGAQLALQDAHRKQQALQQAQKTAQDDALRCQIMAEHLPAAPLPDPDTLLPQPDISREQIKSQIPQLMAQIQTARTQLDTWQGQIQAIGNPANIAQQRQSKSEQLSQLQQEYEALQMAMDTLEDANLTLQNRFSPALGARAAEIFSEITGGRYNKVLLSRDFSLSAEAQNDPTGRNIQLLSQGTADQLYLAVRMAICDMVLPADRSVPLILDDAFLSFDDARLHAALDYLHRESKRRQVILFTCQKREQTYLAEYGDVHLLALS